MTRRCGRFLLISLVVIAVPATAAPVAAQTQPPDAWTYKVEVFGNVGHGRLYEGDSLLGSGVDFGGGAGVRPFPDGSLDLASKSRRRGSRTAALAAARHRAISALA